MNWGYRDEPGITVDLRGGGYQLQQVSTDRGLFVFDGLGQGYALLRPLIPTGQGLKAHTDEVVVPLRCDKPTVANLGIYSGDVRPVPPARLIVATDPASVQPGETIDVTLTVRNDLPTAISNAVVTDLFPQRLKPVSITASRGEAVLTDGRMLALWIGQLDAGETVSATVGVRVDPTARQGEMLANRVSLLYAESMADQQLLELTVGEALAMPVVDAPADGSVPEGQALAAAEATPQPVAAAPAMSVTVGLTTTAAATGEQAPMTLPVTGGETALLPLAGLVLAGLGFASRLLRR